MKKLTCTDCGSNDFRETDTAYVCVYCNSSILKAVTPPIQSTYPKKRLKVISFSLIAIFAMMLMGYNLLYDVKENIETLVDVQQDRTIQTPQLKQETQTQKNTYIDDNNEKNPFSDTILKVESKYGNRSEGNALEEAISRYQTMEKNKAFYLAIQSDGEYAFGFVYGAKNTKLAEKEALKFCETHRKKSNIQDSCIPYALNDNVSRMVY